MAPTPSSSGTGATTSVQVALRIRPTTTQDASSIPARFQRTVINALSPTSVSVDGTSSVPASVGSASAVAATASSSASNKKQIFTFDQVHPPAATQHSLFTSTAQPLISRFVEGFNCTILAYGQTSSGKTFTMTGIDLDADPRDSSNGMGIIPRAVSHIFARCKEVKEEKGSAWNWSIKGSFIEIYNEDLLDLLSVDESGARREVQIREDKQGHIFWEGLREVNVKNTTEVMSLIRKGTSIRRTNETDMNAQSSRSHAIFSLTLTQRKFTGSSAPPPRSSSPLPPGGRSSSRIGRPGSLMAQPRVASPTFGRPPTPSFHNAMGRGIPRPASSLGLLTPDGGRGNNLANGNNDDDHPGEWITVVSKFHFVDLAGSERLKRTSAAGERIKEGISINSGLLALGNVISALGDPSRAKSHTASYVPYRDSKLTRLLQDSLGGNAHTLMIACVSPAEWNAAETLNTLKYANRARNIKNRAVVNEKEEGWDDMEWLQGMVTRLRKELKQIKENGGVSISVKSGDATSAVVGDGTSGKRVAAQQAQIMDLQNNYEDLREKFVERTEELTRLRQELAIQQRSKGGHIGGTGKYEEIVGPVIEEYEKTISAMEAELKLNRAALRHTNELVEEKEMELSQLTERHGTTELYVEELRSRVAKLTEREASTEAYIRDLEEKVKLFDESSISSSGSITDLRREITKFKDSESYSTQYIADLEARLARSDESVLSLRASVENLEQEVHRRQEEVNSLKTRLDSLTQDGQSWRTDLEQREKTVRELEMKMQEWEAKRREVGEERDRLGGLVDEVAKARQMLEVTKVNGNSQTPSETSSINGVIDDSNSIESQLVALQQTHTATLADLSSVSSKYRDALREIADLAAQLQEAKVNAPPSAPLSELSESPERGDNSPTESPSPRTRRLPRGPSRDLDVPVGINGRRPFFRQVASSDSLHTRSLSQSVSLSQELSSARSRNVSMSSHGTSNSVSFTPSHSHTNSRQNLSISLGIVPSERSVQSLEQEIMRLQEVLKERESEITALETSLKETERRGRTESRDGAQTPSSTQSPGSPYTPVNGDGDSLLSNLSPKTMKQFQALRRSLDLSLFKVAENGTPPDEDESVDRLNELMMAMAQKESAHKEAVDSLNDELNQVQRQLDELTVLSRDQTLNMATELEAFRAKREEDLAQLELLRAREAELVESLQKAEAEHTSAIEELKAEHEAAIRAKESEVDTLVQRLKDEHNIALSALRDELTSAKQSALSQSSSEHDTVVKNLQEQASETEVLLTRAKEEHAAVLQDLRQQVAEASATLTKVHQEHTEAFGKLKSEHEEELLRRTEEAHQLLERTKSEHAELLESTKGYYDSLLKQKDAEASEFHQRTEEEFYEALTKLRIDHAAALDKQAAESTKTVERLKDEHAREIRMAEIAREGSLTESESARDVAIRELQEEHSSAMARKESLFAEDLQRLKEDHTQILSSKDEQHRNSVQRLKADHKAMLHDKEAAFEETIEKLMAEHERTLVAKGDEHRDALEKLASTHEKELKQHEERSAQEMERLNAELVSSQDALAAAKAAHAKEFDETLRLIKEQHAAVLHEVERGHETEVLKIKEVHQKTLGDVQSQVDEVQSSLTKSHAEELAQLTSEHSSSIDLIQTQLEEVRSSLQKSHSEDIAKINSEHRSALDSLQSELIASQEQHRRDLEDSRSQVERLVANEKSRLSTIVAEMEERHAAEKETLLKDKELLVEEVTAYRTASDEFVQAQEAMQEDHDAAMKQQASTVVDLKRQLSGSNDERDSLKAELAKLRAELQSARDETVELVTQASKRESLVGELEKHRSVIAEMQENLQKTKDEMDTLHSEKLRQDAIVRDLQTQLSRSPSPGSRPATERAMSFSRVNGLPPAKLPPLSPPPAIPPPPTPRTTHEPQSSIASSTMLSMSSRNADIPDTPTTPSTSLNHSLTNGVLTTSASPTEAKLMVQVHDQARQLDEQEVMIKTLNKQLNHCEVDLQAHMDMVATLETSLAESEKNLRKARMQATELARERDNLNGQIGNLRTELMETRKEVTNVRRSIVEEKQSLEHRLDEERKAKERVRAQLDSRMDELQRKKSKFACL